MFSNQSIIEGIIFIFGMCVGSFLNVCIYRIPLKKSIIHPGSACPHCQNSIPFYLNIPIVSYLILGGKCWFCKKNISIRYPLIEFVTALFFVFLFIKFDMSPMLFFWFAFFCSLLTISIIDLDHQIIPDKISIPGIFIFTLSFLFIPEMTIKNSFLGILLGGGSLYAVAAIYYLVKKEVGMGGGDIKLLAMIGAATGVQGVVFTIFTGSLLGSIAGVCLMAYTKVADTKLKIPFGPYLSLGAVLYIFFGEQIIKWYLNSVILI